MKWRLGLGPSEDPPVKLDADQARPPAVLEPDIRSLQNPYPHGTQITWIGHSTFLIQTRGVNFLTDPIFSKHCSPFPFFGIKRLVPPGIPLEKLPRIDAVLITHNHYDHLDAPTVERLGNYPRYFVPFGLVQWFRKRGIDRVVELDWWQSIRWNGIIVHCVPAQHFSGRSPFDRNRTLWCSWLIETPGGMIFFSGDTGYCPFFREIRERFGPVKISIIPIGSYRPRWFMASMHVDPPEAVKIHLDLCSTLSIGSHWGTFPLGDEPPGEPPVYLRKSIIDAGIGEDRFRTMKIGETIALN